MNDQRLFKNRIPGIILFVLLSMSSCCFNEDEHFWFPGNAISYYNTHDTIRFYCPETDQYEIYAVADRDTAIAVRAEHPGRCSYYEYEHIVEYTLKLINSDSAKEIKIVIDHATLVRLRVDYYGTTMDVFRGYYNSEIKSDLEIFGKVFENTINLHKASSEYIDSVFFSLDYGIIQYSYADATFKLKHHEN